MSLRNIRSSILLGENDPELGLASAGTTGEHEAMDEALLERTRLTIYRHFAADGRAPSDAFVAETCQMPIADVAALKRTLADRHHLVIDEDGGILMAHPFSSIPLGFSVMGPSTLWWGGCAWDAFAVASLVPGASPTLVATTCPACGRALACTVTDREPPAGTEVAHFLTPAAHIWDDVVHTCANQRLFCDEDCVERWLFETGNDRGAVLDLGTLWRLATTWYQGRLDSPYVRREPSEAAEFFAGLGLTGPFWDLRAR